jgi:hypothetical protein
VPPVSSPEANVGNDLQIAPTESTGPNFGELKTAFENCLNLGQSFVDQCRLNYLTRYALWSGQSADGKKHAREGSKITPTPWDGASDLRVYEVDGAINKKVALYRMAFKRANIIASPIEGNDFKRARIVSNWMRWVIKTQIPDVDREIELLANFINEKGIGAMGVFWETKQEKTLSTVTVEQMQAQIPDMDIMVLLLDETMAPTLTDAFERQYGCSPAKAKKMLRELVRDGKTTVPTLGRKRSYPVLRAFDLSENLFIPADTADIETATGIYRVEYLTPEALRARVRSDGWDEAWVEKAIETCAGKQIALVASQYMQPINRSFVYQTNQNMMHQIGVVYAYQRLSDEDGTPGIYLTIFNPMLPPDPTQDGYAKTGLLDYAHGQYPFTIFRREFLSRQTLDTRGIPEPGKSWQDAIKAHMDSRIDAASIAIIPPMGFPMGRPPTQWGPMAKVPERRPGEYHFLDRPQSDPLTEQSQAILAEGMKDYCGFLSKDSDPQYVQAMTQNEIDRFLSGLQRVFTQVYALNSQFGEDRVMFRVMGVKDQDALEYVKGDINESFDFYLQFDVQSTDMDKMEKRWAAIIQGIQLLNREGNVNFAAAIQTYIESIDPTVAEVILDPTAVGRDRIINDEQNDLSQLFAGISKNIKIGTPPQLALEVIQNYVQAPDVQQRLQSDQAFRERLEARVKQYKMQQMQETNKTIGIFGAKMPGETMQ